MQKQMANSSCSSECVYAEHWYDDVVVIGCSGVVDMLTAPELERRVAVAMSKQPSALIIDLTAVDFLASHGLSVLVGTHDRVSPEVAFVVVADGPATSRPMTLTGLTDIITVQASLSVALKTLEV